MNKKEVIEIIKKQLAIDLNCSVEDFNKEGIIYCNSQKNDKQRKYIRSVPYIEMATMGKACIISLDDNIKVKVEKALENKTRNEISECNVMIEGEIHYIPDINKMFKRELPKDYDYEIKEKDEIKPLYKIPGFENSIQYGENYVGPDEIVLYARKDDEIIAMAGASEDSEIMWQIGVDVKEEYRSKGLATALVSNLADIIIKKGKIPYYSTTSSNIPSQLVAYKCDFMPFWYSMKTLNTGLID